MRLDGFHIHGFRELPDLKVDLSSLAGRLIALCGKNGAGKSMALELAIGGAMYRMCPTRGSLASLAVTRDAFVESRINNGQAYTIKQVVDAHNGKGESLVLDADGKPVFETTKVSAFDAWGKSHLLSPEVLYSSGFIPQKTEGIVDLKAGDRKGMLLRAFGIERVEKMAKAAADRAKAAKVEVDKLRARLTDERERTPDLERAKIKLEEAEKVAAAAAEQLHAARTALDRMRAAAEDAQRTQEIAEQRRQVEQRLGEARGQVADIETRIGNNRGLLARADEIRAAVARDESIQRECEGAREKLVQVKAEHEAATRAQETHETAASDAAKRFHEACAKYQRADERLKDREAIEAAKAELPEWIELVAKREENAARMEEEITHLQGRVLTHKDDRINGLRGTLRGIADDHLAPAHDIRDVASRGIMADDNRATEEESLPILVSEENQRLSTEKKLLAEARQKRQDAERLAAREGEMAAAEIEIKEASGNADKTLDEHKTAWQEVFNALSTATDLAKQTEDIATAIAGANRARNSLAPTIKHVAHLDQAQARIEELEPQLEQAQGRVTQAETELAGLPNVEAEDVNIEEYETAVTTAEQKENDTRDAVTRCAKTIEDAEAGGERIETLNVELADAESELSDWTRLAQDLGRDGLQAIEIGNAGPELNEQANALLHECHGPRFTVEIETDRLDSKGKRLIEDLVITVHDSVKGTVHAAETYSGGERVIISEALSLAITVLACRKNEIERPTLIRDETGAALDPDEGRAYVSMLRRAADIINADRVLFVTHNPALQNMADAKIEIRDGQVMV